MIEKLADIEHKFQEIERKISDPEIIADQSRYQDLLKQHAELEQGVTLYKDYKKITSGLDEAKEMLSDPEMKEIAQAEIAELTPQLDQLKEAIDIFLMPKDPNDTKNALVEIRQGTGGDEASLFAGELYRMYVRFAESQGWKTEVMSEALTDRGGVKEIVFRISGTQVFGHMRFESGTHRVQRVPETESQGRVHTSAATVAIMPEAEEVDIEIDAKDLRTDVYRASGAGGQHVNKTSSAVRITHIPTGVVAACQDERSQFQNKEKAMLLLRTRLYEAKHEKQRKEAANLRKSQVGSGDRSEKIRTYNFPQNRLTDHRINLTLYSMTDILSGKLDEVVHALMKADRLEKMKE